MIYIIPKSANHIVMSCNLQSPAGGQFSIKLNGQEFDVLNTSDHTFRYAEFDIDLSGTTLRNGKIELFYNGELIATDIFKLVETKENNTHYNYE